MKDIFGKQIRTDMRGQLLSKGDTVCWIKQDGYTHYICWGRIKSFSKTMANVEECWNEGHNQDYTKRKRLDKIILIQERSLTSCENVLFEKK